MKEPSPLARRLFSLVERIRGSALSQSDAERIETSLHDHDLAAKPPDWMTELFDDILQGRTGRRVIPAGYPSGENGLANVLATIEEELGTVGIDDYGEGINWPIPALGVRVVVIRECHDSDQRIIKVARLR
jgi:hypothetical protein